eukprot:SAG22_NODE_119_length_19257_cov_43.260413_23_plen_285_part_00
MLQLTACLFGLLCLVGVKGAGIGLLLGDRDESELLAQIDRERIANKEKRWEIATRPQDEDRLAQFEEAWAESGVRFEAQNYRGGGGGGGGTSERGRGGRSRAGQAQGGGAAALRGGGGGGSGAAAKRTKLSMLQDERAKGNSQPSQRRLPGYNPDLPGSASYQFSTRSLSKMRAAVNGNEGTRPKVDRPKRYATYESVAEFDPSLYLPAPPRLHVIIWLVDETLVRLQSLVTGGFMKSMPHDRKAAGWRLGQVRKSAPPSGSHYLLRFPSDKRSCLRRGSVARM